MIGAKSRLTAGTALVMLGTLSLTHYHANAADHQEAPGATAQLSADIGDYYVWHEGDRMNMILTFGTFGASGAPANFNRDTLYGFHFDTSGPADGVSDIDIYARFAQDIDGNWGLQVSGIGDSPLEGPVETALSNAQLTAWAGLADDPFFFDLTGFNTTVSTGTLSFDPTRDDVAGLNVTAIAIQLPIDMVKSGGGALQTWTTTSSM